MQQLYLILFFSIIFNTVSAQISYSETNAAPNPNAALDIESTTQGVLISRMTTSQKEAIPGPSGLLVYDSDTGSFWYYENDQWNEIGGTDDQIIDVLNLNGTTLEISLQDDGEGTKTLDLSTLNMDKQTIDVFALSSDVLELSLENDEQDPQTVDLSSFKDNTDNQTIDSLSLNENVLTLSLENDGQDPYSVDLSQISDLSTEESFNAGFLGFESSSSLSVNYEEEGVGFFVTNSTDPSWQSFTATENGMVDYVRITFGNNPGSSYTYTIYEGEGTGGEALGTSTINNPNGNVWVPIDFESDSIVLAKGRKYTLGFDSRYKNAYENNNPHPGGRAGNNSSWDYVIQVYLFPAQYALSVENENLTIISGGKTIDLSNLAPVGTINFIIKAE